MKIKIQKWKESSWRVRPSLSIPDLDPDAVQYRRSNLPAPFIAKQTKRITRKNFHDEIIGVR